MFSKKKSDDDGKTPEQVQSIDSLLAEAGLPAGMKRSERGEEVQAQGEQAPSQAAGKASNAGPSVLSWGVVIKGTIASPGPLHFEGRVEGAVEAPTVSLGVHGSVDGKLSCDSLSLEGVVEGEVKCKKLQAGRTARIKGTVNCESLELALGASINGDVIIGRQ